MKKIYLMLLVLFVGGACDGQNITTVAGGGTGGDGGPATAASIICPEQMTIDLHGNIYFTEALNHSIRKVDLTGIITTVAGTGTHGFSGDGGAATLAMINEPSGITTDTAGNIFFCDQENCRIRKIEVSTGIITTIAGNGMPSYGGDNGPASAATLNYPYGVYFKKPGELYISDNANHRVRKINASGIISTIVGNGMAGGSGDGEQATAAQCSPGNLCFDASGNMYISDAATFRVRKVNIDGIITTIAGNSSSYIYNGDNIAATSANISPTYIGIGEDGLIYIPDSYNNRVRKVDNDGIIHTVAGNGTSGYTGDGDVATAAEISNPNSVAFDSCGNLYIAQINNPRIRKVTYPYCGYLMTEVSPLRTELSIFPNPATNQLQIDNIPTPTNYRLHNIVGTTLQHGTLKAGNNSISLNALPTGMYLLELIDEEGNKTVKKIIKE